MADSLRADLDKNFIAEYEKPLLRNVKWECLLCEKRFREVRCAQVHFLNNKAHRQCLQGLDAGARAFALKRKQEIEAWRVRPVQAGNGADAARQRDLHSLPPIVPLGRRGSLTAQQYRPPLTFDRNRPRQASGGTGIVNVLNRRRPEPTLKYRFVVHLDELRAFFGNPTGVELPSLPPFDSERHRISYIYEEYSYFMRLWEEYRATPQGEENFTVDLENFRRTKTAEQRAKHDFDETSQVEFCQIKRKEIQEAKKILEKKMTVVLKERYGCPKLPPPAPPRQVSVPRPSPPRPPPPGPSPPRPPPPGPSPPGPSPPRAVHQRGPTSRPVVEPVRVRLQGPVPSIIRPAPRPTAVYRANGLQSANHGYPVGATNGAVHESGTDHHHRRHKKRKKRKKSKHRSGDPEESREERKRRKERKRHHSEGYSEPASPDLPISISPPNPSSTQAPRPTSANASPTAPDGITSSSSRPAVTTSSQELSWSFSVGLTGRGRGSYATDVEEARAEPIDLHLKRVSSTCQFFIWRLAAECPLPSIKESLNNFVHLFEDWGKEINAARSQHMREKKSVELSKLRNLDTYYQSFASYLANMPLDEEDQIKRDACFEVLESFLERASSLTEDLWNQKPSTQVVIDLVDSDEEPLPTPARPSSSCETECIELSDDEGPWSAPTLSSSVPARREPAPPGLHGLCAAQAAPSVSHRPRVSPQRRLGFGPASSNPSNNRERQLPANAHRRPGTSNMRGSEQRYVHPINDIGVKTESPDVKSVRVGRAVSDLAAIPEEIEGIPVRAMLAFRWNQLGSIPDPQKQWSAIMQELAWKCDVNRQLPSGQVLQDRILEVLGL